MFDNNGPPYRSQFWLSSKRYLAKNNDILLHFSVVHDDYYSALKYATKEDKDAPSSAGHPNLSNTKGCPKTTKVSKKPGLRAKRVVNCTRDI